MRALQGRLPDVLRPASRFRSSGCHDASSSTLLAQRAAIVAGDGAELPALVADVVIDAKRCGRARRAAIARPRARSSSSTCRVSIRMRQHQVMMEGAFPHELKAVFDAYEVQSNPWGLPADTRGDWAQGSACPSRSTAEDIARLDYLFYVGSAESFDPRGAEDRRRVRPDPPARRRALRNPRRARDLDRRVRPPRRQRDAVPAARRTLVETLNEPGVERIVTCDPHAFNTLRTSIRNSAAAIEVVHHTQLMRELHRRGPRPRRSDLRARHLPRACYLAATTANTRRRARSSRGSRGTAARVRAAPRKVDVLRRRRRADVDGGKDRPRGSTSTRVEQALPLQPTVIATACPYCATMMSDAAKAMPEAEAIMVRDIAEIVSDAIAAP